MKKYLIIGILALAACGVVYFMLSEKTTQTKVIASALLKTPEELKLFVPKGHSKEFKETEAEIEKLQKQGKKYYSLGKYSDAEKSYRKILEIIKKQPDIMQEIKTFYQIGEFFFRKIIRNLLKLLRKSINY